MTLPKQDTIQVPHSLYVALEEMAAQKGITLPMVIEEFYEYRNSRADNPYLASVSDKQIKHMADRFLGWRLPEHFNPDCGISFKKDFNENAPWLWPVGTNLFSALQAEEMVRNMVKDLPARPDPAREALVGALEGYCAEHERHHCFLPYPHEKCPCELCKIATAALAEQAHK